MEVRSVDELLTRADGRAMIVNGNRITLATRGLDVEQVTPDWRTGLLSAITDPNVAMILMMVGVYGLIFDFMNPGAVYRGMVGAICLIVGLSAFAALPMTYAGLALLMLGIGLMVAELFKIGRASCRERVCQYV